MEALTRASVCVCRMYVCMCVQLYCVCVCVCVCTLKVVARVDKGAVFHGVGGPRLLYIASEYFCEFINSQKYSLELS